MNEKIIKSPSVSIYIKVEINIFLRSSVVEQTTVNRWVTGSNPVEGAIKNAIEIKEFIEILYAERCQSGRMEQSWKLSYRKIPRVRISVSPPFFLPKTERWQSGLTRTPAKGVYRLRYRGFESLSFRHFRACSSVVRAVGS